MNNVADDPWKRTQQIATNERRAAEPARGLQAPGCTNPRE